MNLQILSESTNTENYTEKISHLVSNLAHPKGSNPDEACKLEILTKNFFPMVCVKDIRKKSVKR